MIGRDAKDVVPYGGVAYNRFNPVGDGAHVVPNKKNNHFIPEIQF